jgi:hypothetical protein
MSLQGFRSRRQCRRTAGRTIGRARAIVGPILPVFSGKLADLRCHVGRSNDASGCSLVRAAWVMGRAYLGSPPEVA